MKQHSQAYAKTQIKGAIKKVPRMKLKKCNRPDSTWITKGKPFRVKHLRDNRLAYAQPRKIYSIQWLCEVFPEAVQRILSGQTLDVEQIEKLEYYKYLVARLHPSANNNGVPTNSGKRHVLNLFNDLVRLCHSIQREGLTAPIDMYMDGEYPVLVRGHRRVEILYQLGRTYVPARIWRTEWLAQRFIPSKAWNQAGSSIHGKAVEQFVKLGHKATDKYWVHNYTPYYDFHMRGRLNDKLRILELGVLKGRSLQLWKSAFSRAKIFGIDKKLQMKEEKRIKLIEGDENDLGFLKKVGEEFGPFDLIVDDALHRPKPQRNSFTSLFPYVNRAGVYAIEDLHPNYREQHKKQGPITMDLFKSYIDKIWDSHEAKGVSFFPNICFVTKA